MKHHLKKILFLRILLSGTGAKNAEFKILLGYSIYALVGTLLLCLPFATKGDVSFVDNLFNASSALSTTGLSTNTIVDSYSFFGQLVILFLIQVGGIGFMTLSSYILLASFHHLNPTNKNLLNITLARPAHFSLSELIRTIIIFSFVVEILGAIVLLFCFLKAGVPNVVWNSIFHSVSSFCTAGFSLFPNGLEDFKFNTAVNITISILAYLGGIGFIVVLDVWKKIRQKSYRITFTSKTILAVTLFLAVFGTCIFYFFEPTIQAYSGWNRFLVSSFHAMSAMTTVGFNTIPIGTLAIPSIMTLLMLMLVGASPSGTGGGLKSTTFPAIFGFLVSRINNRDRTTVLGNTIPESRVHAAIMSFVIYVCLTFLGIFLLSFFENHSLTELFFETISAIGTVGLSMGITADLTTAGKIILTGMMLIGRIGVLTFGALFLHWTIVKNRNQADDLVV